MSPTAPGSPVRVGVAGGSGYTGREVLGLLAAHPGVEVVFATARAEAGLATPVPGLVFEDLGPEALERVDLLFCCLPHGAAAEWVEAARRAGARAIDLTADHRPGSGRENGIPYGLVDRFARDLTGARIVANPGCYPTGVILALAPLLDAGVVDLTRPVTVSAASGVTGAGRSPRADLLFAEVYGDFRAYSLGNGHRHLLEMRACLPGLDLLFVPHLLPVPRGILETMSVTVREGVDAAQVRGLWQTAYAASATVRVIDVPPTLARVVQRDCLELAAFDNDGLATTLTLMCAFDNLGKGAAGQAVENMNLMLGFPPGEGLRT